MSKDHNSKKIKEKNCDKIKQNINKILLIDKTKSNSKDLKKTTIEDYSSVQWLTGC